MESKCATYLSEVNLALDSNLGWIYRKKRIFMLAHRWSYIYFSFCGMFLNILLFCSLADNNVFFIRIMCSFEY